MLGPLIGHRRWTRLRHRVPREVMGLFGGGLLAVLVAIYLHELTHLHLFAQYGCEASIRWLVPTTSSVALVQPAEDCWRSLTATQRSNLRAAQLMVEAVGYQVVPLYGLLGAAGGFVFAWRTR